MPDFIKNNRFNFDEDPDYVFVIAEIGVNHDGDRTRSLSLTDMAKECAADVVKFQAFNPPWLCNPATAQAGYQLTNQKGLREAEDSFLDMLYRYEMSRGALLDIRRHCDRTGIQFLCTPFDVPSLWMLVDQVGVKMLKIASGQVVHMPLLVEAGRTGLPVIMSSGVANLEEIGMALTWIAYGRDNPHGLPDSSYVRMPNARELDALAGTVALMQCTTNYPATVEETNLNAITSMINAFGLPVGFSDHTGTTDIMCGAIDLGARFLETHITYDKNAVGPDHKASHDRESFIEYIRNARLPAGKRPVPPEASWGDGIKVCQPREAKVHDIARNGVWALRDIQPGEPFVLGQSDLDVEKGEANIKIVRSVNELTPASLTVLLEQKATKFIAAHSPIPADQIPQSLMKREFIANHDPSGSETRARITALHKDMGLLETGRTVSFKKS